MNSIKVRGGDVHPRRVRFNSIRPEINQPVCNQGIEGSWKFSLQDVEIRNYIFNKQSFCFFNFLSPSFGGRRIKNNRSKSFNLRSKDNSLRVFHFPFYSINYLIKIEGAVLQRFSHRKRKKVTESKQDVSPLFLETSSAINPGCCVKFKYLIEL